MAIFFILPLVLVVATLAAITAIATKPAKPLAENYDWAIIDCEFIEFSKEQVNG